MKLLFFTIVFLCLAELLIAKGIVEKPEIVSRDKPTRQVSTLGRGRSSKAVDGDISKHYRLGHTCSYTKYHKRAGAWWYVDLLNYYYVSQVVVSSHSIFGSNSNSMDVYVGSRLNKMKKCGKTLRHVQQKEKRASCHGYRIRYVKVRLNHPGHLALCEVSVFGIPESFAEDMLVSEKKRAKQSSTALGGVASRAVDGRASRHYYEKSCTRTRRQNRPWWEVDLGKSYDLEAVVIYNRAYFGKRLRSFDLLVRNSKRSKWQICGRKHKSVDGGAQLTLLCFKRARYVRIQLRVRDVLSLCEVRVYAYDDRHRKGH